MWCSEAWEWRSHDLAERNPKCPNRAFCCYRLLKLHKKSFILATSLTKIIFSLILILSHTYISIYFNILSNSPLFYSYYAVNLPLSDMLHFPILCTTQYNSHCMLTFFWLRTVNLFIPLQYVISANTGSIIWSRREYILLYFGVSIFSLIFCERFSSYFDIGI